jgi:hypothetical protein
VARQGDGVSLICKGVSLVSKGGDLIRRVIRDETEEDGISSVSKGGDSLSAQQKFGKPSDTLRMRKGFSRKMCFSIKIACKLKYTILMTKRFLSK